MGRGKMTLNAKVTTVFAFPSRAFDLWMKQVKDVVDVHVSRVFEGSLGRYVGIWHAWLGSRAGPSSCVTPA